MWFLEEGMGLGSSCYGISGVEKMVLSDSWMIWISNIGSIATTCTCVHAKLLSRVQVCATLWTSSLAGSSVHGILQSRILEWVATPSSRGIFPSRDRTHVSHSLLHWQAHSLLLVPSGKPHCNPKCLQMHQTLSLSGVWPKCALFSLLDHCVLTKTLALIGGSVNKDFG